MSTSIFGRLGQIFGQLATGVDESPIQRRALFEQAALQLNTIDVALATLNPAETTVVSNPPTQAEVQAINDRLKLTRQALCQ